jgi:hypothetical protein
MSVCGNEAVEGMARDRTRFAAQARARATNRPLTGIDGRLPQARRRRDIYRAIMDSLGNPDDVLVRAQVLHAAELIVAVEEQRRRATLGESVDLNGLVRLSNLADRALRKLKAPSPKTPFLAERVPSLGELVERARQPGVQA